jgi:hypothetical protein
MGIEEFSDITPIDRGDLQEKEQADHDEGFAAGEAGKECDLEKSEA